MTVIFPLNHLGPTPLTHWIKPTNHQPWFHHDFDCPYEIIIILSWKLLLKGASCQAADGSDGYPYASCQSLLWSNNITFLLITLGFLFPFINWAQNLTETRYTIFDEEQHHHWVTWRNFWVVVEKPISSEHFRPTGEGTLIKPKIKNRRHRLGK